MVVEGRAQAAGELGAGVDRLGHRDRRRPRRQSAAGAFARGRRHRASRDPAGTGPAGADADPAAARAPSHAADPASHAEAAGKGPRAASDADACAAPASHPAASGPDSA